MISVQKAKVRRHQVRGGQATWRSIDSGEGKGSIPAGFRTLVSFREELLAPGSGFEIQDLRDLEILTYVLEGAVILEDTRGRTMALEAGEFHRASIRNGTVQRGYNGLRADPARVFQGFVTPDRGVLQTPSEKRRYPIAERRGVLRLVVSRSGQQSSLRMRQDAAVYSSVLDRGHHLIHELAPGRGAWLAVVAGRIQLGDEGLESGDAASYVEEAAVSLTAQGPSEILLFDLR
jgi:redox-sensitive bicupin YhaK (pirin superfamily)